MARTREFDTGRAVEAIAETFWSGGYDGTGIAELVEASGVGRQSLYGAFGSKKEMLLVALDEYLEDRISMMLEPLDSGSLDAIAFIFQRFPMAMQKMPDRFRMGCMMVNTATEAVGAEPEVSERALRYRGLFRDAFRGALDQAVARGEIAGSVDERADVLMLWQMGMFVTARSGSSVEEVGRLSSSIVEQITAWRIDGKPMATPQMPDALAPPMPRGKRGG